jgi:tetratricopeptide (TPR) repeat protein
MNINVDSGVDINIDINPSPEVAQAAQAAEAERNLNEQALQLSGRGDLHGAVRLHLQAIELKERRLGEDSVSVAISRNALGELYVRMGKYEDAEANLKKAVTIRNAAGPTHAFDAAVSRENLAALYETKDKFLEAKELRLQGCPDSIACGNYKVLSLLPLDLDILGLSQVNSVPGSCFRLPASPSVDNAR